MKEHPAPRPLLRLVRANHFYERVLNAHIHPMVSYFFSLNQTQVRWRLKYLLLAG